MFPNKCRTAIYFHSCSLEHENYYMNTFYFAEYIKRTAVFEQFIGFSRPYTRFIFGHQLPQIVLSRKSRCYFLTIAQTVYIISGFSYGCDWRNSFRKINVFNLQNSFLLQNCTMHQCCTYWQNRSKRKYHGPQIIPDAFANKKYLQKR